MYISLDYIDYRRGKLIKVERIRRVINKITKTNASKVFTLSELHSSLPGNFRRNILIQQLVRWKQQGYLTLVGYNFPPGQIPKGWGTPSYKTTSTWPPRVGLEGSTRAASGRFKKKSKRKLP